MVIGTDSGSLVDNRFVTFLGLLDPAGVWDGIWRVDASNIPGKFPKVDRVGESVALEDDVSCLGGMLTELVAGDVCEGVVGCGRAVVTFG